MLNKYYQQELDNLRELASQFTKVHPALAPLLGGPSADPDVERLLEGVAFLTGLLQRKLEDDFPEIVHGLIDLTLPFYLRPIPSTCIAVFTPKPNLQESLTVPVGTSLASVPVEGTTCLFRTSQEVELHPLRLKSAESIQPMGQPAQIRLVLELTGPNLSQWQPKRLGFYLGDSYTTASDLFLLLHRFVKRVTVKSGDGASTWTPPPGALRFLGLDLANNLLQFPSQSFRGYRLIQEYFILPQKFLFLELTGWEQWTGRGKSASFELSFELLPAPLQVPKLRAESFQLFATPVINLFDHDADPITLDHRTDRFRIRPTTQQTDSVQVYSVESVAGFTQGTMLRREYSPLEMFSRHDGANAVYQVVHTRSPITGAHEVALSIAYPPGQGEPVSETLSIRLTCSNGSLPERLQLGDICRQTDTSPELATFRNITPPTSPIEPPIGDNVQWRLLAHLALNFLSLANIRNLREMLQLYNLPGRDRARTTANQKRLDGLLELTVATGERLSRGTTVRGQTLSLTARQDHFAGLGDLFLFGSVMDQFLGVYSAMNTFTQFQLTDSMSGESFKWPARIGARPLI